MEMSGTGGVEVRVRHCISVAPMSDRALELRTVFGVEPGDTAVELTPVTVPTTGVTLVTGFSGTGKSSLLRELARTVPIVTVADLAPVGPGDRVVDLFDGDLNATVALLGRFGLGEPRLMLAQPAQLSDGQGHRLTLARLANARPGLVMVDEFCSTLDRTTAAVIAHNTQRVFRSLGRSLIVATGHDDLLPYLCPDTHIFLDFDGSVRTTAGPEPGARIARWVAEECVEGPGSRNDYERLAGYHYRSADERWIDWDTLVAEVRTIRAGGQVVAVKVFCWPFPAQYRTLSTLRQVNEAVLLEERVIVHPAFRGLGLNARMWPSEEPGVIVAQSALGRAFPFHLRSGYRQVPHPSETPSSAQHTLAALLCNHDAALNTSSTAAICAVLEMLTDADLDAVRAAVAPAFAQVTDRQIRFLAELAGVEPGPLLDADIAAVVAGADAAVAAADSETLAVLVEYATPFRMAGFVRHPRA